MGKKRYPPWTKLECSMCEDLTFVARADPKEVDAEEFLCAECESYMRGWDLAKKEYSDSKNTPRAFEGPSLSTKEGSGMKAQITFNKPSRNKVHFRADQLKWGVLYFACGVKGNALEDNIYMNIQGLLVRFTPDTGEISFPTNTKKYSFVRAPEGTILDIRLVQE